MAYATSACVVVGFSNDFIKNIAKIYNILQTVSIGSTHVDSIAATSAYADVYYVHYKLLTVAYMPRQQYKKYITIHNFVYILTYFKFVL